MSDSLEQRLAEARALLKYTSTNVWMIPAGENRLECFGCGHSVALPERWNSNTTKRQQSINAAIEALDHEDVCIVTRIRAFLAKGENNA